MFSGDVVYELPYGRGKRFGNGPGSVKAVFGHGQVSTVVSARTGLPVNVTIDRTSKPTASGFVATGYTIDQRPDRVPGVSLTLPGGSRVSGWINPDAFAVPRGGVYGNSGRDIVRVPGLWQADLGLARRITFHETIQLQLRAEIFNVFYRAQYGSHG